MKVIRISISLILSALILSTAIVVFAAEKVVFPKEAAEKAIIVAFTNFCAEDVFSADGTGYDPAKFHGYNYNGNYKQQITNEGTWTAKDNTLWHVDNLYLKTKGYSHFIKVCCDITFDGNIYTISGVRMISGGSVSDIESENLSRTSGWETMEPNDFYRMLVVPKELIFENESGFVWIVESGTKYHSVPNCGNINPEKAISVTEKWAEAHGYIRCNKCFTASSNNPNTNSNSADSKYDDWVGGQFSIWDGSHKELTKLIKKSLNDEKSYKHINTEFMTCTTQDAVDYANSFLKSADCTQRVDINDILISTEFSCKNNFNATVKICCLAISHYKSNKLEIVYMG